MSNLERMVILVTPEQKRLIVNRAKSEKLSMGEMVRRSVEAYQPEDEEALLEELLTKVKETTEEAHKAIDEAEKEVAKTLRYFAAQRAKRAEAV